MDGNSGGMMSLANRRKIGLVGFGEAGRAFASGWERGEDLTVATYDLKLADPVSAEAVLEACRAFDVLPEATSADALAGAGQVFSLVTADRAAEAAAESARSLEKGALYFD